MNIRFHNMMRAVLCVSIMQVVCIGIIMLLSYTEHTKYEDLVICGVEVYQETNAIMEELSGISEYVMQYMESSVDSSDQIEKALSDSNNKLRDLSDTISLIKDADVLAAFNDFQTMFGTTVNHFSAINQKIREKKDISTSQYNYFIAQTVNDLQTACDKLIIHISELNESNIESGNRLISVSQYINVVMAVAMTISVICCYRTVSKNGTEMVVRQEIAEKTAIANINQAYKDALTGLWNRKYMENSVKKAIHEHEDGCFFMVDLDNFKSVNDTYGHIAGDNVIIQFAKVIRLSSRGDDICCRMGGDEFCIFAKGASDSMIKSMAERIIHTATVELKKVRGGGNVTVSIGIARLDETITTFQQLYDNADGALYRVKENGKNAYAVANP